MPFIFPKRFLRPRDVLDPFEYNQDKEPVQELLDGELDRTNFNGKRLKSELKPHPESDTGLGSELEFERSVAEDAYYQMFRAESEVPTIFESGEPTDTSGKKAALGIPINKFRGVPNFFHFAGKEFREDDLNSQAEAETGSTNFYTNYTSDPFVVPNSGEWDAVTGASCVVSSGQDNLYINAFLQYVWQGFFEPKPPWRYEGATARTTRFSYMGNHKPAKGKCAQREAQNLNNFGPSDNWVFWQTAYSFNAGLKTFNESTGEATFKTPFEGELSTGQTPMIQAYPYAYPLNEASATEEAERPQLGGYHHISKGFYPCLVQFAIRVDGRILDDTITGKTFSFEESAHGLRIDDSALVGDSDGKFVFGQRSASNSMSYEDTKNARPGQKIRASRATACGPEILPVRIGAVIPVSPGSHTVEIVARRLIRKRKKFEVGDFVGVFSRRLNVMKLPIFPVNVDGSSVESAVTTKSLVTEDLIDNSQKRDFQALEDRVNNIRSSDIKKHSLPHTHLPSKVTKFASVGVSPSFSVGENRETVSSCVISSRFPGFKNLQYLDRRVIDTANHVTAAFGFSTALTGAGWQLLHDGESGSDQDFLSIKDETGGSLSIAENEKMLIFADVEVRGIRPELDMRVSSLIEKFLAGEAHPRDVSDFYSFILPDRYLDLFALFNIGYRTGTDSFDNWTIGSKFAPAVINSSNWLNRTAAFLPSFEFETKHMVATQGGNVQSEVGIDSTVRVDLRGNQGAPNNLGITVPLMLCLDSSDFASEADRSITEIGVLGCTAMPFWWDGLVAHSASSCTKSRQEGLEAVVPDPDDGSGAELSTTEKSFMNAWMSPARSLETPGRGILSGVDAHIGRCRLTVIKMLK